MGRITEASAIVARLPQEDRDEAYLLKALTLTEGDPFDAITSVLQRNDRSFWRRGIWLRVFTDLATRAGYPEVATFGLGDIASLTGARPFPEREVPSKLRMPPEERNAPLPDLTETYPNLLGYEIARLDHFDEEIVAIVLTHEVGCVMRASSGGYWLTRSTDGGETWEAPLYLGLQRYDPYRVAPRSRIPLRYGDIVRIEVDTQERKELVLEIPMERIRRDTDRDGLTDLLEQALLTRPDVPDTDGDELPDATDLNPRVAFGTHASDAARIIERISAELRKNADYNAMPKRPALYVTGDARDYAAIQPAVRVIVTPERRTSTFVLMHKNGERAYAEIDDGAGRHRYKASKKDGAWTIEGAGQTAAGFPDPWIAGFVE